MFGDQPADKQGVSETAIQALLYTKFASLSASLRPLLAELEHRVRATPNELSALIGECHSAWVSTRQALLGSRVNSEVARMEPMTSDLVDLVNAIGKVTSLALTSDARWVQLPQADLYRRVHAIQDVLPFWRIAILVSSADRQNGLC